MIVSPVFNEARHIERVAAALDAQTRRPDAWIVVDDGSTDGTREILRELEARLPYLSVVDAPPRPEMARTADRLAAAAAPVAFNFGLSTYDGPPFAFVGKLDGDIELPPDYYERILDRFRADPQLGIACGNLLEDHDGSWRRIRIPPMHVHGALKLYRSSCFERIGGVRPMLGWDTIDQTYARLYGYRTRSYAEITAVHHRPWGSADGTLRGRARHGTCAWICGYGLTWILLRSGKLALSRPRGISGLAFLWGYLTSPLRGVARVPDRRFRRHLRRELRGRLADALRPAPRPRAAVHRPAEG